MENKKLLASERGIQLIILTAEDLMDLDKKISQFIEENS